ncbi:MAG: hypothetical protein KJ646_05380 [Nanoarchaeota archaeon]|nr:hypothetical protein [Nanoarchaeota archaeon]
MPITKQELTEKLEQLETYKGRQTELISVYIAAGYDVNSVQRQLEAEKSTAKNIKSTATRKNVSEALEKIVRHLKTLRKTPENGLAVFCGNVSKVEGQDDMQLWDIEPPMPLKIRLYRCDKEFVLEPLKEMMAVTEVFGLLVMDRKEATIGLLEGKRIEVLQKMTSGIPSKVRAGGQCLHKSSLVETPKGFKKIESIKIGDKIKALDMKNNTIIFTKCLKKWNVLKKVYRIILTDTHNIICSNDHSLFIKEKGKIKEISASSVSINHALIDKKLDSIKIESIIKDKQQIDMIDIETDSKNFFANDILVHNSSQRFHRITEGLTRDFYKRIAEEMKTVFFTMPKLKGILVGGPVPTKDEFLEGKYLTTQLGEKVIGRIDIGDTDESGLKELVEKSQDILVNQEIMKEKKLLEKFFETLGEKPDMVVRGEHDVKKALEFGAVDSLFLSTKTDKQIAKELKKIAESMGSKIETISIETTEGEQFFNLSGIGALLRFKIN